jgi:hypothetical protein
LSTATAPPTREWWTPALVVILFLVLGFVGILNHELWRDEAEIWIIARDSATPSELLVNMGTEGHPALWYLLNFLLTRATTDPLGMQLLNLALGAGAALLFFLYSPFTTVQRFLFCFGYYLLYEFTVISRSYALALLLTFAFCTLFVRRRRLDLPTASILFLLANTTLYGTIVAAQVVLLVLLEAAGGVGLREWLRDRRAILGVATVLLGVALGFGHTWMQARAIGPAHAGAHDPQWDLAWLSDSLATVWHGAVPLPDPTVFHSWNSNLLDAIPAPWGATIGALLGVVSLVFAVRGLRSRPAVAVVFALGAATMLSITFFVWYGSVRHHGQVFLWFLVCLWLWRGPRETTFGAGKAIHGHLRPLLTALLAAQALAGAYAYAMDLAHPFSNAKAAGTHLRRPEFAGVPFVGSIDYAVSPIAAFVDREFYYPESGRFGTFLDWGPSRRLVPLDVVLNDAVELLRAEGRGVLLVLSYQPATLEPGSVRPLGEGVRLRCFARFSGALVADENYYMCQVFAVDGTESRGNVDSPSSRDDNYLGAEQSRR